MDNENNLQQYAPMMKAYLSLQVASQTSINFLNSRKLAKEAMQSLGAFGLPLSESRDTPDELISFARYFIESSLSSKSYRSAIFGTMSMSDEGAATRLAEDIETVTGKTADKLGISKEIQPLRKALFEAFLDQVKGGDAILKELNITL